MTITEPPDTADAALRAAIATACGRIAPTWPLDQFIAVNPYWGWRGSSAPQAAAWLGSLAGTRLTMPRAWFREEWAAGRLGDQEIDRVAMSLGDPGLAETARHVLHGSVEPAQPAIVRLPLVTDVRDVDSAPRPGQTWVDLIAHQIGQHCAAHFDLWQGSWHPDQEVDLYAGWREQLSAVHGVTWQHGSAWAREQICGLPAEPERAVAVILSRLGVADEGRESYLTALLLSVNGWAAWCAYGRWQGQLIGEADDEIVGLLAIRVAWEWLLWADADADGSDSWRAWADSWSAAGDVADHTASEQRVDWLLQLAVERTYQQGLINGLADGKPDLTAQRPTPNPQVQAVFCIDVRSEVFRRALEAVAPEMHTRGFAGFFGLPISYSPIGSSLTRPQLPGLLAPALNVRERTPDAELHNAAVAGRAATLGGRTRWNAFRTAPSSVFSFVESMGLLYGLKLVKQTVPHGGVPAKWEHDGLPTDAAALRPRLALVEDDPESAASIAHRVLTAMGLTDGFAPVVLICGHGSQTENNPHAAGLDCGACGGQTGEVNARALADLLNSPAVRAHLVPLGITVPAATWFVPGLHNTTTDEVRLFDTEVVPVDQRQRVMQLHDRLVAAGRTARADRAAGLGLDHLTDRPDQLERAVQHRATDWSQVRPEWGLAGNASFIVAPRQRTRHMNLDGRSFLHDYDWRVDPGLSTLTLIMTAPMVVANWINMQYHASTVDNRRYGSGNKVLHNVVGGRIGVFEGNGGDLRIGLAMQSLHDGHTLRHPPLRLSVFIEAPRDGIDSVIAGHDVVLDLVANGWLHLLRIESSDGTVERWTTDGWVGAPRNDQ